MQTRTVEIVASPREPHLVGNGFRVPNFIPRKALLDFMESAYQAGAKRASWDIEKLSTDIGQSLNT